MWYALKNTRIVQKMFRSIGKIQRDPVCIAKVVQIDGADFNRFTIENAFIRFYITYVHLKRLVESEDNTSSNMKENRYITFPPPSFSFLAGDTTIQIADQ